MTEPTAVRILLKRFIISLFITIQFIHINPTGLQVFSELTQVSLQNCNGINIIASSFES